MFDHFFGLNDVEKERVDIFYKKHYKKCKSNKFTLDYVGTGIGIATCVVCKVCGKEKNVTDYDSW